MAESYTFKRAAIVGGSLVATWIAYAIGHAILPVLGAPFAGAAGYAAGIVTRHNWS